MTILRYKNAQLLNRIPFFPLYYNGNTKFSPIHCSDLTDVIYLVISKNIYSKIIECVGPETITFKQIIEKLLKLMPLKWHYYNDYFSKNYQ